MVKKLNLNAIRIDGGTQPRERIDMDAVGDYADAIKAGTELPPIVVFNDGAEHWLADGFHRYHAHKQAGRVSISADVRSGTLDDAKLFASGANASHGLRRTNEDKRRAVQMTLSVQSSAEWSDTKVAEHCGVSVPFVSAIRRPEVAERQQAQRAATAAKQAPDRNPITPKPAKRTLNLTEQQPADEDQLIEAQHTISELAQENDQLRDKLAVESLMDSEEAKTQTLETIQELRDRVRVLEAEVDALKSSRDTYMRESAERLKQINYWRKQAEKAAA